MGDPVVYVSTYRIKDGKSAEYRRFYEELVKSIRDSDREVLAFYAFGSADGTSVTNVHVFPDAPTLDRHMAIIGERMGLLPGALTSVLEVMEPMDIQVYGEPQGQAAAMDKGMMDSGVPFSGRPVYLGGFSVADVPERPQHLADG
jgi:hypothetical protein